MKRRLEGRKYVYEVTRRGVERFIWLDEHFRDSLFKYAVALLLLMKEEDGGYYVQCLELPGCISRDETRKEAIKTLGRRLNVI